MRALRAGLVVAMVAASGIGLARAQMGNMPGMQQGAAADTAATTAYKAAMGTMMRDMDIRYTGDADRDFVAGMLPHHQGAVDMAKVELRYGHDPALRKLAKDIVAAQDKEIAFMKAWQTKHR